MNRDTIAKITLSLITAMLLVFAVRKELGEGDDSFKHALSKDSDSTQTSLWKIRVCSRYRENTVRWRRVFIGTVLSCILAFTILYKPPSPRSMGVWMVSIFTVFTFVEYLDAESNIAKSIRDSVEVVSSNLTSSQTRTSLPHPTQEGLS
jgi:hypothetical protein